MHKKKEQGQLSLSVGAHLVCARDQQAGTGQRADTRSAPTPGMVLILAGLIFAALAAGRGWAEDKDYVIAKAGKQEIYFSDVAKVASKLDWHFEENFDKSLPWRLNFIQNYVTQSVLTQKAERETLDQDPEVALEIVLARRRILSDVLIGRRINEIRVSSEEIRKYYDENMGQFGTPEKIRLSYLGVKDQKEADEVVSQLKKGKGLKKIDKKKVVKVGEWISQNAPLAAGLEDLKPEQWKEIFKVETGRTSDAIETPRGFYFFQVDEQEKATAKPFEEVRQQVEMEYAMKVRQKVVSEYLHEIFLQEGVEIYEDEIRQKFEETNPHV